MVNASTGDLLAAAAVPVTMKRGEYARHRHCSAAAVTKWCKTGKLDADAIADNGDIIVAVADRQLEARLDPARRLGQAPARAKKTRAVSASGGGGVEETGPVADFADARRRREMAQAELAELQLSKARGELVQASELQAVGAELAVILRQELQRRRPELAQRCLGLETAGQAAELLRHSDDDLCRAMAESATARLEDLAANARHA